LRRQPRRVRVHARECSRRRSSYPQESARRESVLTESEKTHANPDPSLLRVASAGIVGPYAAERHQLTLRKAGDAAKTGSRRPQDTDVLARDPQEGR
jgi:hypothetical protein